MVSINPRPLVLCGPSGSGKSTLLQKMLEEFPGKFGFSVSHTTRNPRSGEINGQHYHFTTKEKMTEEIEAGKFIETAIFSGNMYGTSKSSVEKVIRDGRVCVLDIDVQGVKQVKKTNLNALYVFIKPPSLGALEERLRARKTENEESLQKRLQVAGEEIEYGTTPGNFDKIVINDKLEEAYDELKKFLVNNVLKN